MARSAIRTVDMGTVDMDTVATVTRTVDTEDMDTHPVDMVTEVTVTRATEWDRHITGTDPSRDFPKIALQREKSEHHVYSK